MEDESLERWSWIDAPEEYSLKERTRIAEVGAAALSKLNLVMKQMKNWREDHANLRRNICQLKTALQDAGKEVDTPLRVDPLIEHHRSEVKRLKTENDVLKKEVAQIKGILSESGEDFSGDSSTSWRWSKQDLKRQKQRLLEKDDPNSRIFCMTNKARLFEENSFNTIVNELKKKMRWFVMGDQNMEIILVNVLGEAAETISSLCEEVVNVTENLHSAKLSNNDLHVEMDKLAAMLRLKSGNRTSYQVRVNELCNLGKELKKEIKKVNFNLKNDSWNGNLRNLDVLPYIEQLANNLMNKLQNDRKAFVAAGDPSFMRYIEKVGELRVNLMSLHSRLEKSVPDVISESKTSFETKEYFGRISILANFLREIDIEIEKLKDENLTRYYRTNDLNGQKYLTKVEEIEAIVETVRSVINSLRRNSYVVSTPNSSKNAEKLDHLIEKLCDEIKGLEIIVLSQDSTSLFARIEQLEQSTVRLKTELDEKDERANILGKKFSNTRSTLEQKIKELKDTQKRIVALGEENKTFKEKTKAMEERILGLLHECDSARKQIKEVQQVKCEANAVSKKLCDFETEREKLLEEIRKVRNSLAEKEGQIEILNKKEIASKVQLEQLTTTLQAEREENIKLQGKVKQSNQQFGNTISFETSTSSDDSMEADSCQKLIPKSEVTSQYSGSELDETTKNLDNATHRIIDLTSKLDNSSSERKRLEARIIHLESNRETLVYQLEAEKTVAEESLKEAARLRSENDELREDNARSKIKLKDMEIDITQVKTEKVLVEKSLKEANIKWSNMRNNLSVYEYECTVLQQELTDTKATVDRLSSIMESTRADLNDAHDKVECLQLENSKFRDNLDALNLRNSELESHVQVALTEKNDLVTRINELNGENANLKDQLNKVKAENEYFSMELHKSRIESDQAKERNAQLQDTSAKMKRTNTVLRNSNEKLRAKINEMQTEQRTLDNQLKSLRTKYETLKNEKKSWIHEVETLKDPSNKVVAIRGIARTKPGELVILNNAVLREDSIRDRTNTRSNLMKIKNVGGKQEATGKTSTKKKLVGKRLSVENESLKFELMNLRAENSEVRLELSRTKEKFEKLRSELMRIREGAIEPISNKLEIVNLCHKENHVRSKPTKKFDSTNNRDIVSRVRRFFPSELSNLHNGNSYNDDLPSQYSIQEVRLLYQHAERISFENGLLVKEITSLRSYIIGMLAEHEKARNELRDAVDEILALKVELTKLRDEKESLRVRLYSAPTELDKLRSEKIALKDELIAMRKENFDLRRRTSELRSDCQKLEQTNVELEVRLMSATKLINKHTMSAASLEGFRDQLKSILELPLPP